MRPGEPFRMNLGRRKAPAVKGNAEVVQLWMPLNPLPYRLCLGFDNPEDLGWLIPKKRQSMSKQDLDVSKMKTICG
ncbi:MAG: hypothetical protein WCS96_14565 [Victivallales bacterium]|jgi:hypothetical protein